MKHPVLIGSLLKSVQFQNRERTTWASREGRTTEANSSQSGRGSRTTWVWHVRVYALSTLVASFARSSVAESMIDRAVDDTAQLPMLYLGQLGLVVMSRSV